MQRSNQNFNSSLVPGYEAKPEPGLSGLPAEEGSPTPCTARPRAATRTSIGTEMTRVSLARETNHDHARPQDRENQQSHRGARSAQLHRGVRTGDVAASSSSSKWVVSCLGASVILERHRLS